jgi:hypothetical protein
VTKEISAGETYAFKRTPADEVYVTIVSDLTQAGTCYRLPTAA